MIDIPGFTGSPLDRADHLRRDPEALTAAMADWGARLLMLDRLDPVLDDQGRLCWTSLAEARDDSDLLLLGLEDGRPRFVELHADLPEGTRRSTAIFRSLAMMPAAEASTYAAARSLLDWHRRHPFCARCGSGETSLLRAGWARKCGVCGTEHWPRTDPVVIMLAQYDGRVLVGRSAGYPPGRYSALAGFVEPGESMEEAVARELFEEAGIKVSDVRYVVSQPWPFPSQLMMACIATATDDALTLDREELEDAIWVDRSEVAAAMAGASDAPFLPPPPYAIAYTLFQHWLEESSV